MFLPVPDHPEHDHRRGRRLCREHSDPERSNPDSYIIGIQYDFKPFYITYSLIKSSTFAFIITSISGFYGYYADGNSLEVGRASTKAVVVSSIVILIFNLILTQVLLT